MGRLFGHICEPVWRLGPPIRTSSVFWAGILDTFVTQFGAFVPIIRQSSVSKDNLMTYRQISMPIFFIVINVSILLLFPWSQGFGEPAPFFCRFCGGFCCGTFARFHWPAHTKCHPGDPGISSEKLEKEGFPLFRPHVINPYVLTCPRNSGSGVRGLFWSVILGTFVTQFGALVPKIGQVSYYWSFFHALT